VAATATTATTTAIATKLITTHNEERAPRKSHLLLSEIPTPAWEGIVMDRTAWNKVLRSIYTNGTNLGLHQAKYLP
jgi:hypothetical protein